MYNTNFISENGVTASAIRNNDVFKTSMPIMATAEKIIKAQSEHFGNELDTNNTITAVKTFILLYDYMESVENVYTKINWKNVSETAKIALNMMKYKEGIKCIWGYECLNDIETYARQTSIWQEELRSGNNADEELEFVKDRFATLASMTEEALNIAIRDIKEYK